MIGARFGLLVAESSFVAQERTRWHCRCDCGKTTTAEARKLLAGHKRSCGCLKSKGEHMARMTRAAADATRIDITGQRFGRLLVTAFMGGNLYECLCDCGTVAVKKRPLLASGDTQSCGCLFRETIDNRARARRLAAGLPEHIAMTAGNLALRNQARALSAQVMQRDRYTCLLCNSLGVRLNAHHIEPWASSPELRFDPLNLATLCRACHLERAHCGNYHGPLDQAVSAHLRQKVRA